MEWGRRRHGLRRWGVRGSRLRGSRPFRLLGGCGLGAMLVTVPVPAVELATGATGPGSGSGSGRQAIVAVVSGDGEGFVLDRAGEVLQVAADGSVERIASLGPYATPIGTAVGGRVVFGGIRCDGEGCRHRTAELAVLSGNGIGIGDGDGDGDVSVTERLRLDDASGWPSRLDGMALVGVDGDTVWVNAGGSLLQVAVGPPQARVTARVPWPGGEPCVVGGVLYDLAASGGAYRHQGVDLAAAAGHDFTLRLRRWDGQRWRTVAGGVTSMPYGQNAYCTPGGFEVRDGAATRRRWTPNLGWRPVPAGANARSAVAGNGPDVVAGTNALREDVAPVRSSTGRRYRLTVEGALIEVADGAAVRWTGAVVPDVPSSVLPPALQVDEAGGSLFWCVTTYSAGAAGRTTCGLASSRTQELASPGSSATESAAPPRGRSRAAVGGGVAASTGAAATSVVLVAGEVRLPMEPAQPVLAHHYNLCSAACGDGVRAHSRDVITWFVERDRPAGVSLNELCYDDDVHLADRLPPGFDGGASYVALEAATACPGAVKTFGNLVRVGARVGATVPVDADVDGSWAQFHTQATSPCGHRQHECRGAACAVTSGDGPAGERRGLVLCSAHLESGRRGPGVAAMQADEYRELVTDRYGSGAVLRLLAGDFNLTRQDADRRMGPAGFWAAAVGPTIRGHGGAHDQIDMVYGDSTEAQGRTAAAAAGVSGTSYCDLQASDHCYVTTSWSASVATLAML